MEINPITIAKTLYRVLNPTVIGASKERLSAISRSSICEFQLEFTNYHYTISKAHQQFKEATRDKLPKNQCNKYLTTLNECAESGLVDSINSIKKNIINYFSITRGSEPRVGIHITTANNTIVNILPSEGYLNTEKRHCEYTAFSEVIQNGIPYLDNNIPNTVLKNLSYRHAGINITEAKNGHKVKYTDKKIISRWRLALCELWELGHDKDWAKYATQGTKDRLYKSHIVIPITFRSHNHLLLNGLSSILNLNHENRSILGYVFIDHQSTHYFDERPFGDDRCSNIDVNVLYTFADMISLFLLTKLTYTDKSATVVKFNNGYRGSRRSHGK
ncbi:hypothetical protein NMQ14_11530 [Methyloversatilis sp. XJ19-13]|uniref:hypothetical protein n=1 Tax=Methyloversatilis sp. XJ19-13 TaxID=2963430 RepID=UPI00211C02B3|nr:hypothetical protein [Methyloversatilis sp. XJ19-13]MCQ9374877.1 hypothetical protein [Methyloversatilis sp. XJ19-13]